MDFASLTPNQKQAVICARVIEQYAHSILNSASMSETPCEPDALVSLYSCFLIIDDLVFHRVEDIRYQCLSQLAGTFNDYSKFTSEITDTVNKYLASWNARRIRFADDPTAPATLENLPTLLTIVAADLSNSGYSIDPLFIFECALRYCKDFSIENPSKESSPDELYLDELNKTFDDLESVFPNAPLWKSLRKITSENFEKYYDRYFSDPAKRASPQQYAVEYTLISWIEALKHKPLVDDSHNLTNLGEYIRDLAFPLGDYSVKKKYITDDAWKSLKKQLVEVTGSKVSHPTSSASKKSSASGPSLTPFFLVFILAFCLMIIVIFGGDSNSTASVSPSSYASVSTSPKPVVSSPELTPKVQPQTGLIYNSSTEEELAPFTVNANSETNYILRLCDGKRIIQSYYIRAGETLSVYVPLGEYSLYYACASRYASWFGNTYLWGSSTSYYKSSGRYEFSFDGEYYNGYTLNLLGWEDSNGNTVADESYSSVWDSLY